MFVQKVVTRRLISATNLVGSLALVALPLSSGSGWNIIYVGSMGAALMVLALCFPEGDLFYLLTASVAGMLSSVFASWSVSLLQASSAWGSGAPAAMGAASAAASLGFLFLLLYSLSLKKQGK